MKFGFVNLDTTKPFNGFLMQFNALGYHLAFAVNFTDISIDNQKNALKPLDFCDCIFVLGKNRNFFSIFNIACENLDYTYKDQKLFIFLDNLASLSQVQSIIKEHYLKLGITVNIYRFFADCSFSVNFLKDFNKENIKEFGDFDITQNLSGDFFDLIVSHKNHVDTSILNKYIFDNYSDYVYSTSFTSLSQIIADLAIKNNVKIKIAESFTGGGLTSSLISIAGASNFLKESFITYSDQAKIDILGVKQSTLNKYGAVSRQTACEMAQALYSTACDIAVATTGNAGPTTQAGGGLGKCFISIAGFSGTEVFEYDFLGQREEIIQTGVNHGLFMLYRKLMLSYTI